MSNIEANYKQLLRTALFTSNDDNGRSLDNNYDVYDVHDSAKQQMCSMIAEAIVKFEAANLSLATIEDMTGNDESHIMHDLWLTINGHGAGFWDGGYGSIGDTLTEICHTLREIYLYVGDDGVIYSY